MYHLRVDNNSGMLRYSLIGIACSVGCLNLEVSHVLLRWYKETQKWVDVVFPAPTPLVCNNAKLHNPESGCLGVAINIDAEFT